LRLWWKLAYVVIPLVLDGVIVWLELGKKVEELIAKRAYISAAAMSALVMFIVSISEGVGAAKAEKMNA
jgi:hypothetical protein